MTTATILIQATALMAALVALRPLLKRYLSARWRCALWALPALRLLLPFEWESSLSIIAAAQPTAQKIQNAVSRLMYPYQLKEEHRSHYEKFVTDHLLEILSFYIKNEDVETLKWMIDEKRLNKEDLNTAMTIARTNGKNSLLPMFMEYQNVNFKPKKKSFDL